MSDSDFKAIEKVARDFSEQIIKHYGPIIPQNGNTSANLWALYIAIPGNNVLSQQDPFCHMPMIWPCVHGICVSEYLLNSKLKVESPMK